MQYVELVKRVDGDELVLAGMFTAHELRQLRIEGYRQRQYNKHGFLVA